MNRAEQETEKRFKEVERLFLEMIKAHRHYVEFAQEAGVLCKEGDTLNHKHIDYKGEHMTFTIDGIDLHYYPPSRQPQCKIILDDGRDQNLILPYRKDTFV